MHRFTSFAAALAATLCLVSGSARAEFCGGEPSIVDEAYGLAEEGELETARRILVRALKHGEVGAWEKATALAVLGEVQVRMGDFRPAAHNFRRAMELDPDYSYTPVRVGLAIALHRLGRTDEALAEARDFVQRTPTCRLADRPDVGCWVAHQLVSLVTEDTAEMFEAMRAGEQVRPADGWQADRAARMRELITG